MKFAQESLVKRTYLATPNGSPPIKEVTMELHDSLFNMRAVFYEESKRKASLRDSLKRLLSDLALKKGSFKLSSGAHSEWYVDARMVTTHPIGARLVAEEMGRLIGDVDAVGGPELGAVPILGALAALKGYPTFIVRKQLKEHGLGKLIEGHLGQRVAVVDDVVTTGRSLARAVQTVKDLFPHVNVAKVVALVDREEGARDIVGVPMTSIFTLKDLTTKPPSG